MQSLLDMDKAMEFLKRNWFKVGIALVLLYATFKKDFSFKINLNTPVKIENPEHQRPPAKKAREKHTQERYTDNLSEGKKTSPNVSSMTDKFNFTPSFSSEGKTKKENAEKRLEMVEESKILDFLNRFSRVAKAEEEKFGIPAPVIMAHGLLHSSAGQSPVTKNGNNYFGLVCSKDWYGEKGDHDGQCYRYYENAWTSFRDHSLYLTTGKMKATKSLEREDYLSWAKAIEKAGENLESDWATQIMNVINTYHLDR